MSLRRLLFRAIQWCLLRVVRFKVLPEDLSRLQLASDSKLFYVLQVRQLSALLVLDEAVRQAGQPALLADVLGGESGERRRFFFLTRSGQPSPLRRNPYEYSVRFERLVRRASTVPDENIVLLPVSLFWGRAPTSQDSVVKALVADNWVTPGFFSQTLRLLIHGRQTLVKFGAPIALQSALGESREPALAIRRVARLLRAQFRRERELVIGPNLSHRQTMIHEVIHHPGVQRAIAHEAAQQKRTTEQVELRARRMAHEIASDYSYPFIRAYDIGLARLWNRIYDGVELHGFDDLAQIGAGAEIIYLPCHRSHIDYLLLSYVIFHRGLQVPHVAAGDNLNLPVVGSLLRRGGAFFLRRSFKGEALYGEVFGAYLHAIIQRGFPIEYFIEGGRSRTGRTLPPKAGMLGMTVESWLAAPTRPIVFVPVYIGYERLIEGETFAAELAGQPKKRETVLGLIRSLRSLRERFGKVHVNLGDPIALSDFHVAAGADPKAAIGALALRAVTQINCAVVVNPINLVALALTGAPRAAIDATLFGRLLDTYRSLLELAPYSGRQRLTALDSPAIIAHAKSLGTIDEIEHPLGNIVRARPGQQALLDYFRNNVLHALVLPSLVASLLCRGEPIARTRLHSIVTHLYPFLRRELFLWRDDAELEAGVEQSILALARVGLVIDAGERLEPPAALRTEALLLRQLAQLVSQPLERYYLVVTLLDRFGGQGLSARALEERASLVAQRIAFLSDSRNPEYFDRASFRAIIASLLEMGSITESPAGLQGSPALAESALEAHELLPAQARLALEQVSELSEADLARAAQILQ